MPVKIDIEHVARLARLDLTDDEKARLREQLGAILEHAAKVGEVAADDVPPTAYAIPRSNVLRPDEVTPVAAGRGGPRQRARGRGRPLQGAEDRGGRVSELCDLTATELGEKLRAREISSVEVLESCLARVDAVDSRVEAFLERTDDIARQQARAADDLIAAGDAPPAAGIPLALKDVLSTRGVTTTCGSKILETYVPPFDCTPWERPSDRRGRAARQDELRRVRDGLVERELRVRAVHNPWDLSMVPGGSSGGSAASVAAGEAVWASGPDTGGSVRQPRRCRASSGSSRRTG
jgi:aspartyl/glutamyl-tRNA(Asn/Gln) amidotransferase C subunit